MSLSKQALAFVLVCTGYQQAMAQENSSPFRPRTDEGAARDAQLLREALNKMQDAKGPINPLGTYLQRNAELERMQEQKGDAEAEQRPTLDSNSKRNVSSPEDIPTKSRGIVLLPGPRYTIVQQPTYDPRAGRLISRDGFGPAKYVSDIEAQTAPKLSGPVTYASANIPINGIPTEVTSNYQVGPALPGGNGGVQPDAVFPPTYNAPVLPNNSAPVLPNTNPTYQPFTAAPVTPAPITSAPVLNQPYPAAVQPAPATPYYPAPAPTYVPTVPVSPLVTAPNGTVLPTYQPQAPRTVNGLPFVSQAPCRTDASYMVSPTVYRQAVDPCGVPTCGTRGNPNAYAPLSYVPQTYMASPYLYGYRNPPYPMILGFGQRMDTVYVSRGIVGQPKAYQEGQPIRNFLRYLSP